MPSSHRNDYLCVGNMSQRSGSSCYWLLHVLVILLSLLSNDLNKLLKVENDTKPVAVSFLTGPPPLDNFSLVVRHESFFLADENRGKKLAETKQVYFEYKEVT